MLPCLVKDAHLTVGPPTADVVAGSFPVSFSLRQNAGLRQACVLTPITSTSIWDSFTCQVSVCDEHASQADLTHRFSHKDTLVIYVHSDTDAEYRNNLQFFVEQAVREEDRCDYVFIVQVGLLPFCLEALSSQFSVLSESDMRMQPANPLAPCNVTHIMLIAQLYTQCAPLHHAPAQVIGSGTVNETSASQGLPLLPSNGRYVYHTNECYDWGTAGWLLKSNLVQVSRYR
jgi:hypothetical protein